MKLPFFIFLYLIRTLALHSGWICLGGDSLDPEEIRSVGVSHWVWWDTGRGEIRNINNGGELNDIWERHLGSDELTGKFLRIR